MAKRLEPFHLFVLVTGLFAVNLQGRRLYAQTSAPTRMLICESNGKVCNRSDAKFDIVWVFDGVNGTATSAAGAVTSQLMIERFDSDSITVHRVDQVGPTAGMTAVYTGLVRGTQISGTVKWSWPDHPGYPASGSFSAVLQDQLAAAAQPAADKPVDVLPPELLVCENKAPCNGAWIIHGSEGNATWFARNSTRAKLTVIRSAPDDILIRRTDITDAVTATYAGSLRGDHYSGTIVWSSPGHPGEATGTWTASVPQTNCPSEAGLEVEDALRIGQNALMFHRDRDALNCYTVAAQAGDALAQAAVGLTYYQGRGAIAQDYTQAFFWLHKAADQGLYAAQRTVAEMYAAGQGTQRDATLAGIYTARADEQKHDLERQQDLEDRAADRRAQVLSSFVLGASFGAFLFF